MSYIINLNSLRKGENIVATLKSKLKEQLTEERNLALREFRKDLTNEYTCMWLDSIERIIKVCEDRKRY